MICKKCGAELNEDYVFCPKCGNRLKRKSKVGIVVGSFSLIMIVGIGITLYASGYYKDIAVRFGWMAEEPIAEVSNTHEENTEIIQTDSEKMQEMETREVVEKVSEEPDELVLHPASF